MELTRVIHPVGQGGFCTETFTDDSGKEVLNVVYDCGGYLDSSRQKAQAKSKIESYLNANKNFGSECIVFISHLHEDHINGLDWFLKNVKVKCLFLPQLTPNAVIEAYLFNYIKSGGPNSQGNLFIDSLVRGEYKTKTIEVEESYDQEEDQGSFYSIEEIESGSGPIKSGIIISAKICGLRWLYIPYNSPYKPNSGIENDPFFSSAKINGIFDFKLLKDLVETSGVDSCKVIYERYFGKLNHNSYSMTLFSGIDNPLSVVDYRRSNHFCCYTHCCIDCDFCRFISPNFLYTGDFEPNHGRRKANKYVILLKSLLKRKNLWHTISGIQVPHHGSRNNYHPDLYDSPLFGYISVGTNNIYKHPNVDTIVNIRNCRCCPIIVSDDPNSKQEEVYRF